MRHRKLAWATVFSILFGHVAFAQPAQRSILGTLIQDPRFTETANLLYITGYADRLSGIDPFTIFMPTNAGWQTGNYGGFLDSMTANTGKDTTEGGAILKLLRGFTMNGKIMPADVAGRIVVFNNLLGEPFAFDGTTMTLRWPAANGGFHTAKVVGAPMIATDGVIYPMDVVMWGDDTDTPVKTGVFSK